MTKTELNKVSLGCIERVLLSDSMKLVFFLFPVLRAQNVATCICLGSLQSDNPAYIVNVGLDCGEWSSAGLAIEKGLSCWPVHSNIANMRSVVD